jgi:excisionase family DNA binding protein
MGRKMISMDAAAEQLGVSVRTVRRLISHGKLRAYRIGTDIVRIDSDDLDGVLTPVVPTGRDW